MKFILRAAIAAALLIAAPVAHAQTLTLTGAPGAPPTPALNQYGPDLIGARAAWAAGYNGSGITVAIGDTGIDPNHSAFAGKIDARSRSFVSQGAGIPFDPFDFSDFSAESHGTHVGGTIASAGAGAPGIAYRSNLVVLKMLGDTTPEHPNASADVLEYLATLSNVMIYNASYGPNTGVGAKAWTYDLTDGGEAEGLYHVLQAGKIVVAAAGNYRDTNPIAGRNPNSLAIFPFFNPANLFSGAYTDAGENFDFSILLRQPGLVIGVTSVGKNKTIVDYAQTCGVTASWCVAAPGGYPAQDGAITILSTLPGDNYGFLDGTSMATPHVSGTLAVMQQAYPSYSARDLANVLFATAENVGGLAGVNTTYGYGLIRLDRAIAGPTTLAAGSAVAVASNQVSYWSQPLTTGGAFSKTGSGYLIIAGRTIATDTVTVASGALGVDGTLTAQKSLVVAQGATLAGFGRINGAVTINGTLAAGQLPNYADVMANSGGAIPAGIPLSGTSPGTLTFQGNVTLTSTASLRTNIDGMLVTPGGPGTIDKIIVTGNGSVMTLGGTLVPVIRDIVGGNNNFVPVLGNRFGVVLAEDGAALAGEFSGLTQPASGMTANTRFDVIYNVTNITLQITPASFSTIAQAANLNPNQRAVAQALDKARPAAGLRMPVNMAGVFNALYTNSAAQSAAEFAALSGEGLAANAGTVLSAFGGMSDVIAGRQATQTASLGLQTLVAANDAAVMSDASGFGPGFAAPANENWSPWFRASGNWSRVGDDRGIAGSHGTAAGFSAGVDRLIANDMLIGAAFQYLHGSTQSAGVLTKTNVYAATLYGTWLTGPWVVNAQVGGGVVSGKTTRVITVAGVTNTLRGSPDGFNTVIAADAGYRLTVQDVTLEPYAGFNAQFFNRNAYGENSNVGLQFPNQLFSLARLMLGVRKDFQFDAAGLTIRPRADIAWGHDLGDAGLSTNGLLFNAPFQIAAAAPGRDAAITDLEVSASDGTGILVFLGYHGEFRANATSHTASAGLRMNF